MVLKFFKYNLKFQKTKPFFILTFLLLSLFLGIIIPTFLTYKPKPIQINEAKIVYGLQNPAFDEPYDDHGPAVNVARKWLPWWINPPPCTPKQPPCYIQCPDNCLKPNGKCQPDYGCYWMQPEFARTLEIEYPYRVRSGPTAQKIFTYGRMGEFGVYQKINLQQSGRATFSIWMQAWMCFDYTQCKAGTKSDRPTTMHFKVGIDPTGGTSPTASSVVWSSEGDSFDQWGRFSVSTMVSSSVITVFTYARPDWDYARKNNDIYLDDASLEIAVGPTSGPTTPTPTATPTTPPIDSCWGCDKKAPTKESLCNKYCPLPNTCSFKYPANCGNNTTCYKLISCATPTPTPTPTPKITPTTPPTTPPTNPPTTPPTTTPTPTPKITATPTATATPASLPGDVNNDGKVNAVDLGIVIDNYLLNVPPGDSRADLYKDNKINAIDLGIVVDNYGKTKI